MSLTIHLPALDDGAHSVVTQIVQCEPNGDHGELDIDFCLDLAAGSRSRSCAQPEQIILDKQHWQSSHPMKNAAAQ
jgi:hypothetical protein